MLPVMQQKHPIDTYIAERKAADPSYTKGKFAEDVGSDRSTIHRLMSGHPSVSHDVMEKIEKVTGIPATALFAAWQAAKKRKAEQNQAAADLPAGA